MDVEFDPAKNADNQRRHGISLRRAEDFDLGRAFTEMDVRKDYGEVRFNAIGFIDVKAVLADLHHARRHRSGDKSAKRK